MAGSPALVSCQPTPRPVRGEGQDDTGVHSVPESADVRGNACQSDMKMGYVDCQGTCHRVRSLSTATNDPIFLAHATRDSVMEVRAESWWGRSSLTIRCLLSPLAFSPLAGHKLNSYLLFRQPLRLSKLDLSVGPVTSRRPIIRPFTFNMLRGERSSTAHRRGRIKAFIIQSNYLQPNHYRVRNAHAAAALRIASHTASTSVRSVPSVPIETRTIHRPSRVAGVRYASPD